LTRQDPEKESDDQKAGIGREYMGLKEGGLY